MIFKAKKEVKRKLNTMHNIETTNHGYFHMQNEKCIFPFSPFALTFVPLLIIFGIMLAYSHEV
jgi:hypothetical protein